MNNKDHKGSWVSDWRRERGKRKREKKNCCTYSYSHTYEKKMQRGLINRSNLGTWDSNQVRSGMKLYK